MISVTIQIEETTDGVRNEFGVCVQVFTKLDKATTTENEGATFCGIAMSINAYMQSRGCPGFNCLKEIKLNG